MRRGFSPDADGACEPATQVPLSVRSNTVVHDLPTAQLAESWTRAGPFDRLAGRSDRIAGLFRPMGGAFPPADRQPRDAVAGAVVSLPSSA